MLNKTHTIDNWSHILLGALGGRLFGLANEPAMGPWRRGCEDYLLWMDEPRSYWGYSGKVSSSPLFMSMFVLHAI
jgi:hypothetical protein